MFVSLPTPLLSTVYINLINGHSRVNDGVKELQVMENRNKEIDTRVCKANAILRELCPYVFTKQEL